MATKGAKRRGATKKKPASKKKKKQPAPSAEIKAEEAREVGRPTTYEAQFTGQAYKLSLLGATDKEMADFFGCCEKTLNNWKTDYPEFLQSIRAGKVIADAKVAESLYDRATGATWKEDYAAKVKHIDYDENGKKLREYEKLETVEVRKSAPPDTAAASLWLRNRRKNTDQFDGTWRDKVDHELTGKDGAPLNNGVTVYLPENGR